MKRHSFPSILLAATMLVLAGGPASSDEKKDAGEAGTQPPATLPQPSIQSSLGNYGDPGGLRAFLDKKGITYQFTYIGEVLGNTTGGFKQGATYEGVIYAIADVDLDKLAGVKSTTLHASGYNIHGRGLSGNNLLDLFTVSSIEAYPDTLLFEAYLEHKFWDDKVALKLGQLSADTEFYVSQTAALFVNATFGWPADVSNNLPSGGPAYPLGTPGIRLKINPTEQITLMSAVFNGDPAGPYIPGQNNIIIQRRDPGGVNFRLQDPPFFLSEGQYAYNQEKGSKALPGTVKVGYFHHFENFQDFNTGNNVRGNDGVYGIIDQMIYRKPGTDDQGLTVFARVSGFPSDRNLINFYTDAGFAYKGLIPGRDDDTIGIAGAYAHISPDATRSDILSGAAPLIRDYQASIEATYTYAVVPGLTLQPDFQYIFHPGANGVAQQNGLPLRDAAVFGLRTTIIY